MGRTENWTGRCEEAKDFSAGARLEAIIQHTGLSLRGSVRGSKARHCEMGARDQVEAGLEKREERGTFIRDCVERVGHRREYVATNLKNDVRCFLSRYSGTTTQYRRGKVKDEVAPKSLLKAHLQGILRRMQFA